MAGKVARETWLLMSALVALSSGIAQLWVSGFGRITLALLSSSALLLVTFRILQVFGFSRLRTLEHDVRFYQRVLTDIVSRQSAAFEEKIEITYDIGTRWSDDVVIEKRKEMDNPQ